LGGRYTDVNVKVNVHVHVNEDGAGLRGSLDSGSYE